MPRCARRTARTRVAVMHRAEPDRLVGARMNVPLIVGIGDGENFLASDVAAVLAHTRRVIFLEEGDVADITADRVTITGRRRPPGASGSSTRSTGRSRPPRRAATPTSCSRRCTSSPRPSARPSPAASTADQIDLDELEPVADAIARAERVELVACGSAAYASAVGAYVFQDWTGLPARWNIGSEFRYSPPPLDERTLVIAVTQSGETADTLAPVRLARERGCPIIAVTNTVGSAITREADAVLFLQAGPGDRGRRNQDLRHAGDDARAAGGGHGQGARPAAARATSGSWSRRCARCPTRRSARSIWPSRPRSWRAATSTRAASCSSAAASRYPVALEGALKLKEVSYVHAEGYAAGELKHGPISLLDAEVPLVAVATRSSVQEKLISNVMEGRARDARVLAVATEGDEEMPRLRRRHPVGARHDRGAQPGAGDHPAPAVRLPHGRRARHGRRPAAQPGEVGHGRVGTARMALPSGARGHDRAGHRHHQGRPHPRGARHASATASRSAS